MLEAHRSRGTEGHGEENRSCPAMPESTGERITSSIRCDPIGMHDRETKSEARISAASAIRKELCAPASMRIKIGSEGAGLYWRVLCQMYVCHSSPAKNFRNFATAWTDWKVFSAPVTFIVFTRSANCFAPSRRIPAPTIAPDASAPWWSTV